MTRDEWFVVDDRARVLERHVRPRRGRPYVHRVSFDDVQLLAYGIGELADRGGRFTLWDLAALEFGKDRDRETPARTTVAAVVLAFAREETMLVEKNGRGHVACDDYDPCDLMMEVTGFNHREVVA